MSLRALMCHDLVVIQPGVHIDRYGNETKDWVEGTTRTPVRGRLAQRFRVEQLFNRGREVQITDWLCYLPAFTVVSALDRIQWEDLILEVAGRPHRAFARRFEHHIQCDCDTITG